MVYSCYPHFPHEDCYFVGVPWYHHLSDTPISPFPTVPGLGNTEGTATVDASDCQELTASGPQSISESRPATPEWMLLVWIKPDVGGFSINSAPPSHD